MLKKTLLLVSVLLLAVGTPGARGELSGQCAGLVEPPGHCTDPAGAYAEVSWGYLLHARDGVRLPPPDPNTNINWVCDPGLPWVPGSATPDPADRCYIDKPASKSLAQTAQRYIFNGAKPVYVEHKDGAKYLVYYAQQNNGTGSGSGVWADPEGPASWIVNGGDEFIVFKAEADDCGARGEDLILMNDHLRPDNGHNWQFKSAFWEKNRGANGKMTIFVKETIDAKAIGGSGGLMVNKILWQRVPDPFNLNLNGYKTILWNCQQVCPQCVTGDMIGTCDTAADEHPYRLTDIHMVDNEEPGSIWDAVGFLTWSHPTRGKGNTPIRIDKSSSGLLYAIRDDQGAWRQFNWGEKLDIDLEQTLKGRATGFYKLEHMSGETYEVWQAPTVEEQSGNDPCDWGMGDASQPTSLYLQNRAGHNPKGNTLVAYEVDGLDVFLTDATTELAQAYIGDKLDVSSRVRDHQFPSDHPVALTWISGFLQLPPQGGQVIGNRYVYAGTRDPLICEIPNGVHKGTGKGVWWGWFAFPNEDCVTPIGHP